MYNHALKAIIQTESRFLSLREQLTFDRGYHHSIPNLNVGERVIIANFDGRDQNVYKVVELNSNQYEVTYLFVRD